MAESPPRPGASKKPGESGDAQGQAAEQSGGKRHATMMGLAPAPHLGGLDASAGGAARAEADARRKRILDRLQSLSSSPPQEKAGRTGPPPAGPTGAGRTGPPPAMNRASPYPEGGGIALDKTAAMPTAALEGANAHVQHSSTTAIIVGNYPNQRAQHGQQAQGAVHSTMPLERPAHSTSNPPPQGHPAQAVVVSGPMSAPTVEPEVGSTTVAMQRAESPTGQHPQTGGLAVRPDPGRLRTGIPGPPPLGMAGPAQIDRFRELRTRLIEIGQGVKLARFTTLVVPLVSGSGGSFIARNLAAAFTMEGRGNSLLVDCNLHRPSQHLAFRTDSQTGLFAFLESPHGQFDRLVQPTTLPGLGLITAGPARFREYFSSQPMRGLMHTIRQTDCFAFLDGPAVQGSPDARILSELADFVILVVGYGKGTPAEIEEGAATFDKNKFAGVVFNEQP